MRLTIKLKLYGLLAASLVFVAGVSASGYWGISSVQKTTLEVAATGAAIRNHVEVGSYNDMTHDDIGAAFSKSGADRQDSLNNLGLHSKVLLERSTAARDAVTDPTLKAALSDEVTMVQQYVTVADALGEAIASNASRSSYISDGERFGQLYNTLQEKIQDNSDQLEEGAKRFEQKAAKQGGRATHIILSICVLSLLLLFSGSFILVKAISDSLNRLTQMIHNIAEGEGDVTKRLEAAGGISNDELGEVSRLFNLFMDKLQEILRGIAAHTQKLSKASHGLLEASQQITTNSGETAAQSKSVSRPLSRSIKTSKACQPVPARWR